MKRLLALITLSLIFFTWAGPVLPHNPFTSKPEIQHSAPEPPIKSQFFVKIILWQHQLKQKMSEFIRAFQSNGRLGPLILLLGLSFTYGAVHAAGPGHGKVVAMSYVLSHRPKVLGGIVFGLCIALIHGSSGILGVLGLRHVIQRSVSQTLASVTDVTQMVSFGLIAVLGLGILLKHARTQFFKPKTQSEEKSTPVVRKNAWPWAIAVGVVPCPAVVMVMLFCLSMDAMMLGFFMAICISLGMGATISLVVTTIILGKASVLRTVPKNSINTVEAVVGMLSGAAIAVFGFLFFIPAINTTLY